MKKTEKTALIAAAFAAVSMTACGGGSSSSPAAPESGTAAASLAVSERYDPSSQEEQTVYGSPVDLTGTVTSPSQPSPEDSEIPQDVYGPPNYFDDSEVPQGVYGPPDFFTEEPDEPAPAVTAPAVTDKATAAPSVTTSDVPEYDPSLDNIEVVYGPPAEGLGE